MYSYARFHCDGMRHHVATLIKPLGVTAAKVFQAIQGHWLSASLGVIMQLQIPEILASHDKPMGFKEVRHLEKSISHDVNIYRRVIY